MSSKKGLHQKVDKKRGVISPFDLYYKDRNISVEINNSIGNYIKQSFSNDNMAMLQSSEAKKLNNDLIVPIW